MTKAGNFKNTLQNLFAKLKIEKIKAFFQKLLQEKNEKVLEDLFELENDKPGDVRIKQRIAEILYQQKHIEEAIQKFHEIATLHEQSQFHLKAIETYKKILLIKPDFTEINIKLAALYLKLSMVTEAANQYRISINSYASDGHTEEAMRLSEKLIQIDPSDENRTKLAEIYQNCKMTEEAIKQYEILAKNARLKKDYKKLLHFYQMILPHKPNNRAILKDICILLLRKKRPERALQVIEQYNANDDEQFQDIVEKCHLMLEALKRQRNRKVS